MTPSTFRRFTAASLVFLAAIIVTGAAVRLTNSGLGCESWPQCEPGALVGAKNGHQAIEQVNRLFTGLMLVAIVGALTGAFRRKPRRKDLTRLAAALIGGYFAQAFVGGLVVLTHLNPAAVMLHFLVSAVVLVAGVVLHRRTGEPTARFEPTVEPRHRVVVRAIAALGMAAVISGTVVTNTGPHGGDEKARRFGLSLLQVVRVHSLIVLTMLAVIAALIWRLRRHHDRKVLYGPLEAVLAAGIVQGAIGYWQWFTHLPVLLVGFHIVGATLVIITLTRLVLATRRAVIVGSAPADPARVG